MQKYGLAIVFFAIKNKQKTALVFLVFSRVHAQGGASSCHSSGVSCIFQIMQSKPAVVSPQPTCIGPRCDAVPTVCTWRRYVAWTLTSESRERLTSQGRQHV